MARICENIKKFAVCQRNHGRLIGKKSGFKKGEDQTRIVKTDQLVKELLKYPGLYVYIGKHGDAKGQEYQNIINVEVDDNEAVILNTENLDEEGYLRAFNLRG